VLECSRLSVSRPFVAVITVDIYLNDGLAMAVMIYALVTYHWRAAAIARRGSGPYDDRLGPVSLSHRRDCRS
jgi:hypothetical protein